MSELGPEAVQRIGAHEITLEGPDVLLLRLVGDVGTDDASRILAAFRESAARMERLFWLIDLSRLGSIATEARRVAGGGDVPPSYRGTVLFGGTWQQRAVARMAATAAWLLWGRNRGEQAAIRATEAEARIWLAERRRGA